MFVTRKKKREKDKKTDTYRETGRKKETEENTERKWERKESGERNEEDSTTLIWARWRADN